MGVHFCLKSAFCQKINPSSFLKSSQTIYFGEIWLSYSESPQKSDENKLVPEKNCDFQPPLPILAQFNVVHKNYAILTENPNIFEDDCPKLHKLRTWHLHLLLSVNGTFKLYFSKIRLQIMKSNKNELFRLIWDYLTSDVWMTSKCARRTFERKVIFNQ